ncbi:tetratricopeptide repeat protein [Streptosporangium sp. NBC_01639]|uniref:AfsR/SARP family transcriptional regulator n=1 Tax=Streptosporangium sp. NBC_01639 TaxID=2975948 RepID=UPI00386E94A9|nr:tetratricopeptide repeat protein [Streptosporangium sp. NBC_01639]
MDGTEFRLLGSVGIWGKDRLVGPATAQQRSVLAMLLMSPGRTVSVDRLVQAVWGQEPPVSARNAIQGYVSRLRRVLTVVPDAELATSPPGYRLDLDPTRVDLYRFRDLVAQARAADVAEAGGLLRQALHLWRGPPLADVAGGWLHETFGTVLEEQRLVVVEERIAIDLRSGRHRESLAELALLMSEHPLRERLVCLMMSALYQEGSRTAALEVFRDARRRLVEELGIEPGEELQHLHRQILRAESAVASSSQDARAGLAHLPRRDDQTVAWPSGAQELVLPVPAELPADVLSFTGRSAEVARLCDLLGRDGDGPARVYQISGIGGIGKSCLAIHVAQTIADRFPDGQLYVNLHGATPEVEPVDPLAALGRMLRSLGMADSAVPAEVEEAAGRFRSLTDGRRMLIMLDNARDAAQVRLLLPGSPTCAVLITSRRRLTSFEGAVQIPLDVFPAGDGVALLSGMVGEARIAAEPAAAADVVRLCGGLPLALCLAAARLNARPTWPVSALAGRLAGTRRRLDELQADDRAVRASFQGSYQDLLTSPYGRAAARMFRLLGLLDGTDLGLPVAAALAGLPEEQAQDLLDHLVDAQLVDNHAPDRYRLHDLLRLFAREQAMEKESEPAREQAVRRALHCHLATARTATRLLKAFPLPWRTGIGPQELSHPGTALKTREDVDTWVDAEGENLLAAVGQAIRTADAELAVALAATFAVPLHERGHWSKQLAFGELALQAAECTGDALHQALIYADLGWAEVCVGRTADGVAHLERSLAVYRRVGDIGREATVVDQLGVAYRGIGRLDKAIANHLRSLALNRELSRFGEGASLAHLGLAYQRDGRFDEAIDAHTRSIAILREVGAAADQAIVLGNLAEAYRLAGEPERSVTHYRRALGIYQDAGHVGDYREAEFTWGLGLALHDIGEFDEAYRCWHGSVMVLHRLGLITAEERPLIEVGVPPSTPKVIQRQL